MGKKKDVNKVDAEELRAQLARALADYDNLTKRVDKERQTFVKLASLSLVSRLLPVVDMLENAQEHLKDLPAQTGAGLAIAIKEFKDSLADEGVFEIEAKPGDKFDEELHEAVEMVPPAHKVSGPEGEKENKVVEVVLTGYKMKDGPVIRPAKVKVGGK